MEHHVSVDMGPPCYLLVMELVMLLLVFELSSSVSPSLLSSSKGNMNKGKKYRQFRPVLR